MRSGDTFINENDPERVVLSGVSIPPPVFFCSIEAELSRDQNKLAQVIHDLTYEDPSITVTESKDTGQLQISGMGELHLEILRDRIELDYGIIADLGSMRVAYRESVGRAARHTLTIDKMKGGRPYFAELTLEIEGTEETNEDVEGIENDNFIVGNLSEKTTEDSSANLGKTQTFNKIYKDYRKLGKKSERIKIEGNQNLRRARGRERKSEEFELLRSLDTAPRNIIIGIEDAINTALESGNLLGYPVIHTKVRIISGKWSSIRSDDVTFKE